MNHHELMGNTSIEQIVLKLHNMCNLNCEHCTNKCHIPIDNQSKFACRREERIITIEEIDRYIDLFKGHLNDDIHLLSGGEPTFLVEPKLIETIMDKLIATGKHRIGIRSNGYNLLEIDEKHLKMFDLIYLDDHNVNSEVIDEIYPVLKKIRGDKPIVVERVHGHYNLRELMNNPIGKGTRCYMWKRVLLLEYDVLWPCCGLPSIINELNMPEVRQEMIDAGWSLHNDDVIATLKKGHLPRSVSELCLNQCWFPAAWTKQPTVPITAKKGTYLTPTVQYDPDNKD